MWSAALRVGGRHHGQTINSSVLVKSATIFFSVPGTWNILSLIVCVVLAPSTMDAKIAALFLVGLLLQILTPASGEYSTATNW